MQSKSEKSAADTSHSVGLHFVLELAKSLADTEGRKHLSFILHKNKIVSIGQENRDKTHPQAVKFGYKYPTIHSELDAYNRLCRSRLGDKLTLINTRVSPTGRLGMSRPCKYCMGWVESLFDDVWYTNQDGVLVRHETSRY